MAKPIEKVIEKHICVQTAVYWGSPTRTASGGVTFADPVEIYCRWDGSDAVIRLKDGSEYVCDAEVMVTQDVVRDGYLYLGSLDDLESSEMDDPKSIEGAYPIRKFEKTPVIKKTDEFIRTAYL